MKRLLPLTLLLACSNSAPSDSPADTAEPPTVEDVAEDTASPTPDVPPEVPEVSDTPDVAAPPEDVVEPPAHCELLGLPESPWSDGPYGTRRHDVAEDFTLETVGGGVFNYREAFRGCEGVVVVTDAIPVSDFDKSPFWFAHLEDLLAASPKNVHYVFVSRLAAAAAEERANQMFGYIIGAIDPLDAEAKAHWKAHLHVSKKSAADLGNWLTPVLNSGIGQLGFGIDPSQHLRGTGSFADVNLYYPQAPEGAWPWAASLAYLANEPKAWNFGVQRDASFAQLDKVTVPLWTGEVISEFAERAVELPEGAFDALWLEVDQRCPNPDLPEPGNCGAWDYLSWLFVYEGDADAVVTTGDAPTPRHELARGITTYHREGRWLADVTPMLARLQGPKKRLFRWEWAPSWNVQPTETRLALHFVRTGAGMRPTQLTPLFAGGGFGSAYNTGREPITVEVPATAKRVELVATITGHGAGTQQCAEFCNHVHEFTVDGQVFKQEHPTVGDSLGCAKTVDDGTVPNQWGTWWFGRGGWCPGNMVKPLRADVTALAKDGSVTVTYRGLLGGADPPDGAGDIHLSSQIVVWE